MHPLDVQDALDGMVILYDTREHETPKLKKRLQQMNCPAERAHIETGDYSAKFPLPDGSWYDMRDICCVERKLGLDELCMNFGYKDRERFTAEFERAKKSGQRLILLVENATWDKIYLGNYVSKYNSKALVANILAWLARYDIRLLMCPDYMSGRVIRDTLYYEGRERLTAL